MTPCTFPWGNTWRKSVELSSTRVDRSLQAPLHPHDLKQVKNKRKLHTKPVATQAMPVAYVERILPVGYVECMLLVGHSA